MKKNRYYPFLRLLKRPRSWNIGGFVLSAFFILQAAFVVDVSGLMDAMASPPTVKTEREIKSSSRGYSSLMQLQGERVTAIPEGSPVHGQGGGAVIELEDTCVLALGASADGPATVRGRLEMPPSWLNERDLPCAVGPMQHRVLKVQDLGALNARIMVVALSFLLAIPGLVLLLTRTAWFLFPATHPVLRALRRQGPLEDMLALINDEVRAGRFQTEMSLEYGHHEALRSANTGEFIAVAGLILIHHHISGRSYVERMSDLTGIRVHPVPRTAVGVGLGGVLTRAAIDSAMTALPLSLEFTDERTGDIRTRRTVLNGRGEADCVDKVQELAGFIHETTGHEVSVRASG